MVRLRAHLVPTLVACGVLATASSARADAQHALDGFGPEHWINQLNSPDATIRRGAVFDLGAYAPATGDVVGRLSDLRMRETDESVLLSIVSALGSGRFRGATHVLRELVLSPRNTVPPNVAAAALRALSFSSDPTATEVLANISTWSPPVVVDAATRWLAGLSDARFGREVTSARQESLRLAMVPRALTLRRDPRWGQMAIDLLTAPSPNLARAALDTVQRLRMVEALPDVLVVARDSSDASLRRMAITVLGTLGDGGEPTVLRDAIAAPPTRLTALAACALLGDRQFVPDIVRVLDADWAVDRMAAADALVSIDPDAALDPLIRHVATEHDASVRAGLLHAIARVGGTAAARFLVAHARTGEGTWALAEYMVRGGHGVRASDVARHDSMSNPDLVLAGLLGMDARSRVGLLAAPQWQTRLGAALSLRGDESGGDSALAARLAHEDVESVRAADVLALERYGTQVAREAIASLLARESSEPLPATVVAVRAIGALQGRASVADVSAIARNGDEIARAAACHTLGALGDSRGIGTLENAIRFDASARVRGVASMALATLRGEDAVAVLDFVDHVAWTEGLIAQIARARRIARGIEREDPFDSTSVLRVSGVGPGTIWALLLPDGDIRFVVASADGEILVTGAPSTAATLERVGED